MRRAKGEKSAIANAGFDLVRKHISKGAGAPGNGPESDLTQGGDGTSSAGHNAGFKQNRYLRHKI
jgi:hypothetical protein